MSMKMFYLSHPYTGDEEKNRAEAYFIAAIIGGSANVGRAMIGDTASRYVKRRGGI